jgi:protein-S-isoprenylcysteine O-methyltransferase Ste14
MNALELKLPPPLQASLSLLGMWLIARCFPAFNVVFAWHAALAILFAGIGGTWLVAGVSAFRRAKTTVNPLKPQATSTLVTGGVYRFSRNPMYVGLLFVLAGWGSYLANGLALLVLPLFVASMTRWQIIPEERIMAAKFGAGFEAYKRSVRRWL